LVIQINQSTLNNQSTFNNHQSTISRQKEAGERHDPVPRVTAEIADRARAFLTTGGRPHIVRSLPGRSPKMADRRTIERRKDRAGSRIDVTRREYAQLRRVLVRLVERVVSLQRQVDDLRRKARL